AWPASAMQTATSTALLLRVVGTENGDYWTLRGWYFFAGVAAFGLLTKYTVRFRNGHVFNPSNIALILAFIILGSDRVEPLDFWWAPLGWAMVAAYAVIFVGGVYICSRLRLIGMGVAFWSSLAVGIGVLAALNHSITVRWSLIPIEGSHFWWIILTSPEIFIFLYFMITDPRTVPSGRVARIVFGVSVGVLASLFMAPWKTEYGAKVGLLSSLAVMCACRKLLERRLPVVGSPEDNPRQFFTKLLTSGRTEAGAKTVAVRVVMALAAAVVFAGGVVVANIPSRVPDVDALPTLESGVVAEIDPASLPSVTIDPEVAGISARLATPEGAQDLAATLAFNLEVEQEAAIRGDATLLPAVDHGARLEKMQAQIERSAGGVRVASSYRFDSLHLIVVFPGGLQTGANAGLVASGTVTDVSYSSSGQESGSTERPFAFTFALRQVRPGHWLITDTLESPS
ncbi:MAG TPA: hypothetical protein VNB52_14020, partial [Ilumatobacteraceae bacterium]|nr:hypothetical protein [Ilumatobacteraceae bacterium]